MQTKNGNVATTQPIDRPILNLSAHRRHSQFNFPSQTDLSTDADIFDVTLEQIFKTMIWFRKKVRLPENDASNKTKRQQTELFRNARKWQHSNGAKQKVVPCPMQTKRNAYRHSQPGKSGFCQFSATARSCETEGQRVSASNSIFVSRLFIRSTRR